MRTLIFSVIQFEKVWCLKAGKEIPHDSCRRKLCGGEYKTCRTCKSGASKMVPISEYFVDGALEDITDYFPVGKDGNPTSDVDNSGNPITEYLTIHSERTPIDIRGVFWLINGDIHSFPYNPKLTLSLEGIAKSGDTYNHMILTEGCRQSGIQSEGVFYVM